MTKAAISPDGKQYHAGDLHIRRAGPEDDEALQQILRDNPMQGWLRLSLERSPSYFAAENLMGRSRVMIGQDAAREGRYVGMYHTAFLPVFINGEAVQAGYLGELRTNRAYRHSLHVLKHGFASIRPLNQPQASSTALWFTSIASDNHTARRLLEADHRKLPRYTPVGELQTLAISTRHGRRPGLLQPASRADIPAICELHNRQAARCNLAPCLEPAWLRSLSPANGLGLEDFWVYKNGERIEACIAVWDQRAYKQAVVQGYRVPLNHLRPLYNLIAYLRKKPLLPKVRSRLESVYLSFFSVSSGMETHALQIMREALYVAGRKGAGIGLIGLAAGNRLLPALRSALHPSVYRTCIETVSWSDERSLRLNEAAVQPEIAIL